jgi:hypothetical protein
VHGAREPIEHDLGRVGRRLKETGPCRPSCRPQSVRARRWLHSCSVLVSYHQLTNSSMFPRFGHGRMSGLLREDCRGPDHRGLRWRVA